MAEATCERSQVRSAGPSRRLNPTAACGILALAVALAAPSVVATGWLGSLPTPREAAINAINLGASASTAGKNKVADTYGKLPLSFVSNAGQTDPRVRYTAQGHGFPSGHALSSPCEFPIPRG